MTLKLLDGFCCQGGASMGYHQVGFVPYGIDINPQPHYPFPFHQGDVIQVLATLNAGGAIDFTHKGGTVEWLTLDQFVAAHKSPPCQAKTKAQKIMSRKHPLLIAPTRELLIESGLPYVIENVVPENEEKDEDPLIDPIELCGAMFGLGTYRHRLFESNMPITAPNHPAHTVRTTKMGRPPVDGEFMHVVGNFSGVAQAKKAMGISWMTRDGLRESIPPAYTHSHRPSVDGSACGGGSVTAPHPGLTDLIAAEVGIHVVETVTAIDQLPWSERQGRDGYLLDCRCGAEVNCPQAEFNAAPVDSTSGALAYMIREHVAAHVALVVEQHTNGRTTELDWDELVAAIPDGWELRESAHLEEVSRVRQRDLEASQATTARWRARAEKAEATIARVEAEAALLERMIRTAPWSRYTEVRRSHLRSLGAALEGPGDVG